MCNLDLISLNGLLVNWSNCMSSTCLNNPSKLSHRLTGTLSKEKDKYGGLCTTFHTFFFVFFKEQCQREPVSCLNLAMEP